MIDTEGCTIRIAPSSDRENGSILEEYLLSGLSQVWFYPKKGRDDGRPAHGN